MTSPPWDLSRLVPDAKLAWRGMGFARLASSASLPPTRRAGVDESQQIASPPPEKHILWYHKTTINTLKTDSSWRLVF